MAVALAAGVAPAGAFLTWGAHPEQLLLPLSVGIVGCGIGLLIAVQLVKHPLEAELKRIMQALARLFTGGLK